MWQNESNVHFLDYIVISSLIAINVIADSIKLCHLPRAFCPRQDFDSWSFSVHSGIIWPAANYAWCIKLQRQHAVQLQIYPLICCKLTQMIKLLKVQPDSKLVWVIDRDFCQATKSRTKTLFFRSDNSFAGNISMPTQKWIRRSSQSIQKRLLDYSIFIPSKLGLPLISKWLLNGSNGFAAATDRD